MNEHSRTWSAQEAKAKFSELIRRAQTEGPQEVTLHGRHVATVYPANGEQLAEAGITGRALIEAMQRCPFKDEYPLVVPGEPMRISEPVDV